MSQYLISAGCSIGGANQLYGKELGDGAPSIHYIHLMKE
jgi:hypothetical protein